MRGGRLRGGILQEETVRYPKVSMITVNWNGKANTIEWINAAKSSEYSNYKIIVVDNGSTDGSSKEIGKNFPDITLIESGTNLGYAAGANVGINEALKRGSDYVFVLNNDMMVNEYTVGELVKVAENDTGIGMVCPKVYWYDNPQRIDFIGTRIDFRCLIGLSKHIGANEIDRGQYDRSMNIDAAGVFLVRREAIEKAGLLSPDYFLYFEDFDWCFRVRRAGYKIIYTPGAVIRHKRSATIGGPLCPRVVYYLTRNRFLLWKRHLSYAEFLYFLICFFVITVPVRVGQYLFLRKAKHLKSFLKGTLAGLRLSFSKVPLSSRRNHDSRSSPTEKR